MGKLTQRMSTFLLPTSVRLAWLNLLRNGRRSLLSVLIIAIAVFALTSGRRLWALHLRIFERIDRARYWSSYFEHSGLF